MPTLDNARVENTAKGLTGTALELATGQQALLKMMTFPAILIVLFIIFFVWQKNSRKTTESDMTMAVH